MSSLTCICTLQVSFCQKCIIHPYVYNFGGGPKLLYSGLWPKLQKLTGQCCRTQKHAMENDGIFVFVILLLGMERLKVIVGLSEASVIT